MPAAQSTSFRPAAQAASLTAELTAAATAERAAHDKRYLKSTLTHLGASVPQVRAVARRFAHAHPDLAADGLVALVKALWAEPVHERRLLAIELCTAYVEALGTADLALLERLAREAHTWALLDPLAIGVAGQIVTRAPAADEAGRVLDGWAADGDFWIRRLALLAHLPGLRAGGGDFPRFARYADAMLDEREFFIRKAIGWVLRETGKREPDRVAGWLRPRLHRVAGLTLREAVKHLPADQRADLLAAWRRAARGSAVPTTPACADERL